MNAQSRVLEQTLRLHQIGYQVIGGPRFYERAEVKDATAYLQLLDNPADAVSLLRIANRPKRGIGDTTISRLVSYAESHGSTLYEALGHPVEAGLGAAAVKAVTGTCSTAARPPRSSRCRSSCRRCSRAAARRRVRGRADDRGARRIENLEAFVDGAQQYVQETEEPTLSASCRRSRSTPTRTRSETSSRT